MRSWSPFVAAAGTVSPKRHLEMALVVTWLAGFRVGAPPGPRKEQHVWLWRREGTLIVGDEDALSG